MTTEVASLDERRAARSSDVHRCACGSEWFRLVGHDGQPPAVTANTAMSVTGYAGRLVCDDCGRTQQ